MGSVGCASYSEYEGSTSFEFCVVWSPEVACYGESGGGDFESWGFTIAPGVSIRSNNWDSFCQTHARVLIDDPTLCLGGYVPLSIGNPLFGEIFLIIEDHDLGRLDKDGDSIPDALESEACSRMAVREQINGAFPGHCASNGDYVSEDTVGEIGEIIDEQVGFLIDEVLGLAGLVLGLVDGDGDLVPDALEPTICSMENQSSPSDGECVGSDYRP